MSDNFEAEIQADSSQIVEALAHGMNGNHEAGLALIQPIIRRGPVQTVSLCAALAQGACMDLKKNLPEGAFIGLLVAKNDGTQTEISVDDMPPGLRFAAQFTAAWANDDEATAYALFDALIADLGPEQAEVLGEGIATLYQMAVESLRVSTARQP